MKGSTPSPPFSKGSRGMAAKSSSDNVAAMMPEQNSVVHELGNQCYLCVRFSCGLRLSSALRLSAALRLSSALRLSLACWLSSAHRTVRL